MGDNPTSPAAPPTPAPSPPTHGGAGWLILAGVVVVAVAGFLAARFQLIPLSTKKQTTAAAAEKMVVLFVKAAPLEGSQRPAGAVYIAEVRGDNELPLSFEVGGIRDQIGPSKGKSWEPGAPVKAGAELARLKQDDFINRVTAAQSRAELTRVTYERMEKLFKSDTIPKQKLDEAETQMKAARAELAGAEQAL